MRFVAVDVETATQGRSGTICQIGVAVFSDGALVDQWTSLVDPKAPNQFTHIHGITDEHVRGAPTFAEVYPPVRDLLQGEVVASHTGFDKGAFSQATARAGVPAHEYTWVDTARVVRSTWPQFRTRGYGLGNIAAYLGIKFQHHDALHDAITAGRVWLAACEASGRSISDWVEKIGEKV